MTRTHAAPHRLVRMVGRDPQEANRVATSLELLYDLTIVVAFGVTASEFAEALAGGHTAEGVAGFLIVLFAVCWAWMNSTWFSSAFDTDDWMVRLATMVQMAGVLILTAGVPELFAGFERGWEFHNQTLVLGYVVMRAPLFLLWWRASRDVVSRALSRAARRIAVWIVIIQVLWILLAVYPVPPALTLLAALGLFAVGMAVPYLLARRAGGIPWHPHHMAERYSLLTIISLGEVVVGTATSVGALHADRGWTPEVALVLVAGVSLAMALWWVYFSAPFAALLARRPQRLFRFIYPHTLLFLGVAATGAGLHLVALQAGGGSALGPAGSLVMIIVPAAVFVVTIRAMVAGLRDRGTGGVRAGEALSVVGLSGVAVAATAAGAPLVLGLALAASAPWLAVIASERQGRAEPAP